jgi:hypothetical protein
MSLAIKPPMLKPITIILLPGDVFDKTVDARRFAPSLMLHGAVQDEFASQ